MREEHAVTPESRRLDGNAAAGRLSEVFVFDATTARAQCGTCGRTAALGEYHVYADAPGMVMRCPTCEAMILRIAQTPGHTWLDMRGIAALDVRD
jgi:NAD-dependent SIR2 family protein deacetylase